MNVASHFWAIDGEIIIISAKCNGKLAVLKVLGICEIKWSSPLWSFLVLIESLKPSIQFSESAVECRQIHRVLVAPPLQTPPSFENSLAADSVIIVALILFSRFSSESLVFFSISYRLLPSPWLYCSLSISLCLVLLPFVCSLPVLYQLSSLILPKSRGRLCLCFGQLGQGPS